VSRPVILNVDRIRAIRQWAATPRRKRRFTRLGMALLLGVSTNTIDRAAHGRGGYGKVSL
jgi:hypothetical protein